MALSIPRRCTFTLGIVLCLATPRVGSGQVPVPAVVFTRATDVPRPVAWGSTAAREDRTARRAILGALVGAGIGYLVGQAACGQCDEPAPVMAVTGVGAALGAVVGFLIGFRSPDE